MHKRGKFLEKLKGRFHNHFLKNVLTLLSGTAIGQLVPVLVSPILTRLYTPDEIGAYTIFFASSNILALVASGRFEFAILIPKKRKEAKAILQASFIYLMMFLLLFTCLSFLFRNQIAEFIGLSSFKNAVLLIPITSFLIGLFQVLSYWSNRNDKYTAISKSKVLQGAVTGLIQVVLSMMSSFALVLGRLLALLVSDIYLFTSLRKTISRQNRKNIGRTFRKILKKYKVYPTVTMPNALLNSVSNNLPNYMLESFYSLSQTGYYSWAVRLIQGPMGMMTSSIQQVFFKKASDTYNKGANLYGITLRMYRNLFFIGIIPYTLLFLFSPQLFEFIFGSNWRIAGEYTRYLTPWLFMMFLNSPLNGLILVLSKQKEYFVFEVLLLFCRGGALFLGFILFNEATYSVVFYGVIGLVFNIFLFIWTLKLSRNA